MICDDKRKIDTMAARPAGTLILVQSDRESGAEDKAVPLLGLPRSSRAE